MKIDTRLVSVDLPWESGKCGEKVVVIGESVELNVRLQEDTFLHPAIPGKTVDFYIGGVKVGSDVTDSNGIAKYSYTPPGIGTSDFVAEFGPDTGYNASTCTGTITAVECNNGIIVKVEDIPPEGLTVEYAADLFIYGCDWVPPPKNRKTVTPEKPFAVLSELGWAKACVRITTIDYDPFPLPGTGSVQDIKEEITLPDEGCITIPMYGWLGCKYRTRITTTPVRPAPGESFTLHAHLIINPEEPAIEGMEIEFIKLVDETEESLGKNLTNEKGIAPLSHVEEEEGTYKYLARYTGGDTYAEVKTVRVAVTPPICPILTAFGGTIVFTKLDMIRWFRDNKLPECITHAYYAAVPITGRIARYSKATRLIIRELAKISIWAIEKRWAPKLNFQCYR